MKRTEAVSLISLIIGVAISGFLVLVLLEIFTTTKNNYKLSSNIIELNDNLRFISYRLTKIIANTGFRTPPSSGSGGIPSLNSVFTTTGGQYVVPEQDLEGSNSVSIYLQGDSRGRIVDCSGNPVTTIAGRHLRVVFNVQAVTYGNNQVGHNLLCSQQEHDGANYGSLVAYPFIDNLVERFWVRYGEDTDMDGYVNTYVDKDNITNYKNILALKIALLLRSRDQVSSQESSAKTFSNIFEESAFSYTTPADKYVYRLHTFTVTFKSLTNSN